MDEEGNKLIIIGIMLLLMATGVVAIFNLGEKITPALSTALSGTGLNLMITILLRFIIAPLLIFFSGYVIYNIIKESLS